MKELQIKKELFEVLVYREGDLADISILNSEGEKINEILLWKEEIKEISKWMEGDKSKSINV